MPKTKKQKFQLPLFKLVINEDAEGMDYMGLVDYPAHGKSWAAFSKQYPQQKEEFKQHFNEDQRIVTGVAIATNLQIYRRRDDGTEYNIVFTKEDTKQIAIALMKNGYMHNVNEMHDMNKDVSDMFLFESYFVDDEQSNIPEAFADQNLQPGTWIVSYKVENDDVWAKIKNGDFVGFSIEGWFQEVEINIVKNEMQKVLIEVANPKQFAVISEVDKWDIEVMESDITIGTELHYIPWEGEEPIRVRDGEYLWDGHTIQVDSNGIVVMIDGQTEEVTLKKTSKMPKTKNDKKPTLWERLKAAAKGAPAERKKFDKETMGEATTQDGTAVFWEGDLAVGVSLFIRDEENPEEGILAEAGDYSWEADDGLIVVTVGDDGAITEINEGEEMDDDEVFEAMKKMRSEFKEQLAAERQAFEDRIAELETTCEQLSEVVEELSEGGEDGKTIQGAKRPGWGGRNRKK